MSTDIKPGQVWAWKGGCGSRSAPGVTFEIVDAVAYRYQPRDGFDSERIFMAPGRDILDAAALLVETVDLTDQGHAEIAAEYGQENADFLAPTTPAPLDPSKVKAGDTVTLSLEGAHVTDVVASWERNPASDHYRAYLTHDPDPFDAKPFRLVGNTAYSLTDHQPAPEPEPEWGTSDVVSARLREESVPDRFWYVDEGDTVKPYFVDDVGVKHSPTDLHDVRPLVVIDPAAVDVDALVRAIEESPQAQGWRYVVVSLLAELGIEAS